MTPTPLLLLVVAVLTSVSHAGPIYKSIDSEGRVIYSDHPPVDAALEKKIEYTSLPASPLPESAIRMREELERRIAQRSSQPAGVSDGPQLFTAQWCGYCRKAKAFLGAHGIGYTEYDIDTESGMAAYIEAGGGGGVPLLVFGERRIQGFSAGGYEAFFSVE